MSIPKKLLLILTIWAYALQAVAGVSSLPCSTHASKAALSAVVPVMVGIPGHHHEMAGMQHLVVDGGMASMEGHNHPPAVAADAVDCDDCKCPPAGCKCSGHGCSSTPGVMPSRSVGVDGGADIADSLFKPAAPLQAFRQGLIRPPSIS